MALKKPFLDVCVMCSLRFVFTEPISTPCYRAADQKVFPDDMSKLSHLIAPPLMLRPWERVFSEDNPLTTRLNSKDAYAFGIFINSDNIIEGITGH